jgi:hypothetical protein
MFLTSGTNVMADEPKKKEGIIFEAPAFNRFVVLYLKSVPKYNIHYHHPPSL